MIRSLAYSKDCDSCDNKIRRNLSIESLSDMLDNQSTVWIDVVDPEAEEIDWLQEQCEIHPLVVQDLRRTDTRPTLLAYTNHIFLSIFQPTMTLQKIKSHEIHCIIGENYFITVRPSSTTAVEKAYDRVAQNPNYWERDVAYFFYLTVQDVVDEYYPLVDDISNQLNTLEESILTSGTQRNTRDIIYPLKQNLITLRRMIAPHRDVLSSVIGEERLARTNENRDLFRHLYERLMRVFEAIDSQRDLSSNVLDLVQSYEARKLNKAVNRLTVFSMLFLPLTFIIGLFELNFISTESQFLIPLSGNMLFAAIVAIMGIIVAAMLWYFRKQGWLG